MLVPALKQKQRKLGLTDEEFAETLGISQPYWSLVKNRARRPGVKFLKGVMGRFPDLAPACLLFLQPNMTDNTEDMTDDQIGAVS